MVDKITLIFCLVAALVAVMQPAEAQPADKNPHIGFLASSSVERNKSRVAMFQQGLHELGYIEGKNIIVEYRSAAGNFERLPELAADLVAKKVDIVVAEGAPAAHAAKKATKAASRPPPSPAAP